jgi:ABC-type amino acid transport system permease subunit
LVFGTILGVLAVRFRKTLGGAIGVLGAIISAIPVLVILFWLHYPLQAALDVVIDPFYTAVAAFSLVNVFGVAGIVKAGLANFPSQYIVAARVCGLGRRVTALRIVIPLLVGQLIPGLLLLQVTMFQVTLFASLISVDEIFRVAQRVNAEVYRPVQIYTGLAILFLIVCLPLNVFAHWLGKRFSVLTSDR